METDYILLVPPETMKLFSSSSVAGSYVADATATVNVTTRTITVLASGNALRNVQRFATS